MGVFDGLGGASLTGGGTYINPGSYDLELVKMQQVASADPQKAGAVFFVVEWLVTDVHVQYEATEKFGPSNKVDTKASEALNMTTAKWRSIQLGQLKNILEAVAGSPYFREKLEAAGFWGQFVEACEDANTDEFAYLAQLGSDGDGELFAGIKVKCEATQATNKNGGPFTKRRYFPLTET